MRVRMLKTVDGSPDGRQVRTYVQGTEYALPDAPDGLAAMMLREGWAESAEVTADGHLADGSEQLGGETEAQALADAEAAVEKAAEIASAAAPKTGKVASPRSRTRTT